MVPREWLREMIGIVAAHSQELKPFEQVLTQRRKENGVTMGQIDGVEVMLKSIGQGFAQAERAVNAFLDHFHPDVLVMTGFAGATKPELGAGDFLVPEKVLDLRKSTAGNGGSSYNIPLQTEALRRSIGAQSGSLGTVEEILVEPNRKQAAGDQSDVAAVDLESAAVASVAQRRKVPWLVVRVVLDPMDQRLDVTSAAQMAYLVVSLVGWGRAIRFWKNFSAARGSLEGAVHQIVAAAKDGQVLS